jgi:predicted DNA-binding transcriptional regulator YafY
MVGVVEQVQFIEQILDLLPEKKPGYDKARLESALLSSGLPIKYRQLQRYLESLEAARWVERTTEGKSALWTRIYVGTKLRNMTVERALVLEFIQHKLWHLLPLQISQALNEDFRLAQEKLKQNKGRAWIGKIVEAPSLLSPARVEEGVFEVVSGALLQNKWLEIDYIRRDDVRASRRLMPLALVSKDGLYYLVGRYADKPDNLQFRLDRIKSALCLGELFSPPADFHLSDYLDQGAFNYSAGNDLKLVLALDLDTAYHLRETPLSDDQQIIEAYLDNKVLLKATVADSQKLRWWLLGLGTGAVVLQPDALRMEIATTVQVMYESYYPPAN